MMSANRTFQGSGISLAAAQAGQAISASSRRKVRHPWMTTPAWNGAAKQWVATIEPGFVNHAAPTVQITIAGQKAGVQQQWGINPLTGKPFFSADVFSKPATTATASQVVDVPIYLAPAIPLSLRALGSDGDPRYAVPSFFQDKGVGLPPVIDTSGLDAGSASVQQSATPRNPRLLRACDFILHQPRSALTSTVTLAPGPATGASNVTQVLGIRSAAPSDALRVYAGYYQPSQAQIDPTSSDYAEANFDELLISTVFLLSPVGAAAGSEPDGTWTPYVRHSLFWNLSWAQPALRILNSDPGTPFIPPLAAGAAQLVINFEIAALNDMTNQALNILSSHSMAGTFWTPTGGGHDSRFPLPPAPVATGSTGLDKDGRLAAKTRAAAQAKRAATLDPDFPYNAMPFSVSLLNQ